MGLHATALHVLQPVGAAGRYGAASPAVGVHMEARVHIRAGAAHTGCGGGAGAVGGVQWGRNGGNRQVGAPSAAVAGKTSWIRSCCGAGRYSLIPLVFFASDVLSSMLTIYYNYVALHYCHKRRLSSPTEIK